MNAERLFQLYDRVSEAPNAVPRLRRFILDLAVRGKLVEQDPSDEPAEELGERISEEISRLSRGGQARRPRQFPPLEPEEVPFGLPPGWAWSQISRIGLLSPRNDAEDDLVASFVPMPNISADYGVSNNHEPRLWSEIKKGYTHFAEGDVGLAKITPCFENGKSTVFRNLTGGIGSGTTELHIVRPLFVSPDYIVAFLKSPFFIGNGIPRMTGTAGQKRVPLEYFAASPFPLPPLEEQHRIVAKVDELMALCDSLETERERREVTRDRFTTASLGRLTAPDVDEKQFKAHAGFAITVLRELTTRSDQIKVLRQTILDLAVRGKLVEQDPNDEPASKLLRAIAEDKLRLVRNGTLKKAEPIVELASMELGDCLPEGWVVSDLQSVCVSVTDGDHLAPPKTESGIPFLVIGDVRSQTINYEATRFVAPGYYNSLDPSRRPARGDLLYTLVGSYGIPVVVREEKAFCVQRHIGILRPSARISLAYFARVMESASVFQQATACATGIAQKTVPLSGLRKMLIPIPPFAEQIRIADKLDELMALCGLLKRILNTGRETQSRLHEALVSVALDPISKMRNSGYGRVPDSARQEGKA